MVDSKFHGSATAPPLALGNKPLGVGRLERSEHGTSEAEGAVALQSLSSNGLTEQAAVSRQRNAPTTRTRRRAITSPCSHCLHLAARSSRRGTPPQRREQHRPAEAQEENAAALSFHPASTACRERRANHEFRQAAYVPRLHGRPREAEQLHIHAFEAISHGPLLEKSLAETSSPDSTSGASARERNPTAGYKSAIDSAVPSWHDARRRRPAAPTLHQPRL
jgi:hypothetical protein